MLGLEAQFRIDRRWGDGRDQLLGTGRILVAHKSTSGIMTTLPYLIEPPVYSSD